MRELKFRAWDTKAKKILFVNDARFVKGRMIGSQDGNWFYLVEIMQYTSLHDKNDREIYEGDIVSWWAGLWIVTWNFSGWHLKNKNGKRWDNGENYEDFNDTICWPQVEIVGNIYENKNLLEGK